MSLPLVSFAVQSTGQLFQITEDIAQWKIDAAARQFLTTLRGVLLAINEALKAISSIPDQRVTDRITALLTNLERLCQVSCFPSRLHRVCQLMLLHRTPVS